jgi:hypothetical protein
MDVVNGIDGGGGSETARVMWIGNGDLPLWSFPFNDKKKPNGWFTKTTMFSKSDNGKPLNGFYVDNGRQRSSDAK